MDAEEVAVGVGTTNCWSSRRRRGGLRGDEVRLRHGDRASRSAVSIAVSTSPASTSSPTVTLTEVTGPVVRKAAVTWSTRLTDPGSEIDWVTEPVATVAVRIPDVAAWLGSASTTR